LPEYKNMSYPLSGRPVHAVLVFSAALAVTGNAVADEATAMPSIRVIAERDGSGPAVIDPLRTPVTLPTTAALLQRAPGANVNFNGPLTAIAQYRGMFAYRVNTQVDGVPVRPGGPNWMDAPLHYAPMPLTETVEVHRGIAPVSAGSETIGGAVQARRRTSRFTGGPDFELHGQIQASGQSVDGGFGLGGLVSAANERHRVHALGVVENGDDTEFPGGRIRPTEYDRTAWGAGYGFRSGRQSFGIDYLHNDTGDTGTPALPNDIRFFDTDIVRLNYDGSVGGLQLEGRLFAMTVDHEMDNFSLRTPPPSPPDSGGSSPPVIARASLSKRRARWPVEKSA
jgi:iron complex outermembrane receptor protein